MSASTSTSTSTKRDEVLGFFNKEAVYDLSLLKSYAQTKDERNGDVNRFPCIPCIARHKLFKYLKINYGKIFDKLSKILEKHGYAPEDIDISSDADNDGDKKFYLLLKCKDCTDLLRGDLVVKISLHTWVPNEEEEKKGEKESLVIITSVTYPNLLDFSYPYVLPNARAIFWKISNEVNSFFADTIGSNSLKEDLSSGYPYLLELLAVGSDRLDWNQLKRLMDQKVTWEDISPKAHKAIASGKSFFDTLITRRRNLGKPRSVLETRYGEEGENVSYFSFRGNHKNGAFIAMSSNPLLFHKDLEFKILNMGLRLN